MGNSQALGTDSGIDNGVFGNDPLPFAKPNSIQETRLSETEAVAGYARAGGAGVDLIDHAGVSFVDYAALELEGVGELAAVKGKVAFHQGEALPMVSSIARGWRSGARFRFR